MMTGLNSLGLYNSYGNYGNYASLSGLNTSGIGLQDTSLASLGLEGLNLSGLNGYTSSGNQYGYNNGLSSSYPMFGSSNQDPSQMLQQMMSYFQSMFSGQGNLSALMGQQQQFPPPPTVGQMFGAADTSGDGVISQDEFTTYQPTSPDGQTRPEPTTEMKTNLFSRLDQDGDGSLSTEEQQAIAPPPPRHQFTFDRSQSINSDDITSYETTSL